MDNWGWCALMAEIGLDDEISIVSAGWLAALTGAISLLWREHVLSRKKTDERLSECERDREKLHDELATTIKETYRAIAWCEKTHGRKPVTFEEFEKKVKNGDPPPQES